MTVRAQELRHRVTVQRKTYTVDPATGFRVEVWSDLVVDEPAKYVPGPGREYLASESLRSEVNGRFVMRWSAEAAAIQSHDRVVWDGNTYDVKSDPLPDETARRELTLMVARGVNDG